MIGIDLTFMWYSTLSTYLTTVTPRLSRYLLDLGTPTAASSGMG